MTATYGELLVLGLKPREADRLLRRPGPRAGLVGDGEAGTTAVGEEPETLTGGFEALRGSAAG